MPLISENFKLTLFADDTTLALGDPCYSSLVHMVNDDLNTLLNWTLNNRLSLNAGKTTVFLVTNRTGVVITPLTLKIGDFNLDYADDFKFLGIFLDRNLNFLTTYSKCAPN